MYRFNVGDAVTINPELVKEWEEVGDTSWMSLRGKEGIIVEIDMCGVLKVYFEEEEKYESFCSDHYLDFYNKEKFKIGDKVEVIHDDYGRLNGSKIVTPKGTKGIIDTICDDGMYGISGWSKAIYEKNLKLINEEGKNMSEFKFKVGQVVRCKKGFSNNVGDENYAGAGYKEGYIFIIDNICGSEDTLDNPVAYYEQGEDKYGVYPKGLELVDKKSEKKQKEEAMKKLKQQKFMIYGTGCDNQSGLVDTEKEIRETAKEKIYDSDWSGDIIIYKLTPIAKVEKSIKTTKIK
jgi:hypothetical protein